ARLTAWRGVEVTSQLRRRLRLRRRQVQRLIGRRSFKPYTTEIRVAGTSFPFVIGDADGKTWYDTPPDQPSPEFEFLRDNIVAAGDVVLECGGHHGWGSVLLSRWVGPEGRVIVFEPNSNNVRIIKQNVELNGCTNVSVERAAVG